MLIILSDYSNQRIPVSELFACWVFCMFLLSVDFLKRSFKNNFRASNSLDPVQTPTLCQAWP